MNIENKFYKSKIINKPWGSEYVIYSDLNKIAITFVKINFNHTTSLHCHPKKKTSFIILEGVAEVQVGIYKSNKKRFRPLRRFVIRPGLFHSLKAVSRQGLYALEVEAPFIKKDLVRLKDSYGRRKKAYEGQKFSQNINSETVIFKKPNLGKINKYRFNNILLNIEKTNKLSKLAKRDHVSSTAILDGDMVDNRKQKVISCGEIVKTSTLKILSQNFKINKSLTLLNVTKSKFINKKKNLFYES